MYIFYCCYPKLIIIMIIFIGLFLQFLQIVIICSKLPKVLFCSALLLFFSSTLLLFYKNSAALFRFDFCICSICNCYKLLQLFIVYSLLFDKILFIVYFCCCCLYLFIIAIIIMIMVIIKDTIMLVVYTIDGCNYLSTRICNSKRHNKIENNPKCNRQTIRVDIFHNGV